MECIVDRWDIVLALPSAPGSRVLRFYLLCPIRFFRRFPTSVPDLTGDQTLTVEPSLPVVSVIIKTVAICFSADVQSVDARSGVLWPNVLRVLRDCGSSEDRER